MERNITHAMCAHVRAMRGYMLLISYCRICTVCDFRRLFVSTCQAESAGSWHTRPHGDSACPAPNLPNVLGKDDLAVSARLFGLQEDS